MKKIFWFIIVLFIISCAKENEVIEEPVPVPEQQGIENSFHYISGTIKAGQPLAQSLISKGIPNAASYKLVNELNKHYDLRKSNPADSFIVTLDSLEVIQKLIYIPNNLKTYRVWLDSTMSYQVAIDTLQTNKVINICEGVIEYSLWNSLVDRQKEGPALAMMLSQIFQWDIDFNTDPQKGDSFKIVYEQYNDSAGNFVRYGNILTATYQSKSYDKTAYRYHMKGVGSHYYDANGKSFQKAFLRSPLNYSRISSYFGTRTHPVTKRKSFHSGVDYAAPYGTPIEAVSDGTVIFAGWHPNHTGNTVKIRHANGYQTLYGHLSKFGRYKTGMRVKQHDIIGYVGSTGRSTGNHLHYTVYHHGKPINPLKINNVSGPPIPAGEMAAFNETIETYKQYLLQEPKPKYYSPIADYLKFDE